MLASACRTANAKEGIACLKAKRSMSPSTRACGMFLRRGLRPFQLCTDDAHHAAIDPDLWNDEWLKTGT